MKVAIIKDKKNKKKNENRFLIQTEVLANLHSTKLMLKHHLLNLTHFAKKAESINWIHTPVLRS